jgi:hypothetical protein
MQTVALLLGAVVPGTRWQCTARRSAPRALECTHGVPQDVGMRHDWTVFLLIRRRTRF